MDGFRYKRLCGKFFRYGAVLSVLISLAMLAGCQKKASGAADDILTQQPLTDDRQVITVLVKYAFTINGFEKAVEEKFPDINIVQVGNYTHEMGIDEYASRLEHDDLPDVLMTWPLDVGREYWEDRLLDQSGMEYTNRYNLSMLNDISQDGRLYYVPGPSQVRGIVYNKTLFEEMGWKVPEDFEGFVELCRTIEDSGIRSLQLGLGNEEVLDTAFVGFSYGDGFSTPGDARWIEEYNQGQHSFGSQFGPALDTFQRLIDEGILKKSDLEVRYSEREKMIFTRECAMTEDSVLMARMGYSQTGTTDQFALMPFYNPNGKGQWARLYMVCNIGLNKHLEEDQNKDKYNKVMELMDYISTPEGQKALMSDTGAMYSSLTGVGAPDVPEIQELIPALQQGHYAVFPTLKNAQGALRKGLAGMVSGTLTKEDVIRMVDMENVSPFSQTEPEVFGTAEKDFTVVETGNFVTDAMREAGGCEIALFLDNGKDGRYNGKGISGRLYKGTVTDKDVLRIFPDLKRGETGTLWKVTMSGEDLIRTLEYSIKVDNDMGGWFYYFSGLKMEYEPGAEPGSRIHKITLNNGGEIQPDQLYTIAVMDDTVPETCIKSCEKTGLKIVDIIEERVKQEETITPAGDGRFVIVMP